MAVLRLLAALGVAHAARHSYVAEHDDTATRYSSAISRPGWEKGATKTFADNQYVLEWRETSSSWSFFQKIKDASDPKWYFITPVMCRRTGLWYKLEMQHEQEMRHCLLVTCTIEGDVEKVEPQDICAEHTQRVLQTAGPYVTRSSDWVLFHIPLTSVELPPVDTTRGVADGWAFDTPAAKRQLTRRWTDFMGNPMKELRDKVFYPFSYYESELINKQYGETAGWDLSEECKEYKILWEEVGLVFTNEVSLELCKTQRIPAREHCVGKYQAMIGTATAWEVKQLVSKTDLKSLPSCHTWCGKNNCMTAAAPKGVKRDGAAMFEAMNSWKYACEQELDVYLAQKVAACPYIGDVCDKPWSDFQDCAQKNALPYFK